MFVKFVSEWEIRFTRIEDLFPKMRLFPSILAQTALIKYHRMGGLNNRNLSSHSSGGQKPEIKVGFVLGLSPCLVKVHFFSVCFCVPTFYSYTNTSHFRSGPTKWPLCNPNYSKIRGLKTPTYEFGGMCNSAHNNWYMYYLELRTESTFCHLSLVQ